MEAVNIYPQLVKWKTNKRGLTPIAIRFDFNRKHIALQLISQSILVKDWNDDLKRVKPSCIHHELINQLLDNLLNKHSNYFLRRRAFNMPVTADLVKQYVKAGSSLESFYEYAEKILQDKRLKDGGPYSDDTKRRYRDEIKRAMLFKPVLPFHQFNIKFLSDYKLWLQNNYLKKDGSRLDKNSIWKAFAFLRMVYNEAVKDEIILPDSNPFKNFNVGRFETKTDKIKYLEVKDLEVIEKILNEKQYELEDLTIRIGWRFLAMCVSGIRISDAMNLTDNNFNDIGDLEIMPFKTRRNGNKAQVPMISERQLRYMQKTLELNLPKTSAKSFRTTFNIHLKVIAALAGINNITSHMGRHTMGSLLVDAGIEDKAAMAMLGVKSDKVIKTYMHLKESKLRSEAQKLKNVL